MCDSTYSSKHLNRQELTPPKRHPFIFPKVQHWISWYNFISQKYRLYIYTKNLEPDPGKHSINMIFTSHAKCLKLIISSGHSQDFSPCMISGARTAFSRNHTLKIWQRCDFATPLFSLPWRRNFEHPSRLRQENLNHQQGILFYLAIIFAQCISLQIFLKKQLLSFIIRTRIR